MNREGLVESAFENFRRPSRLEAFATVEYAATRLQSLGRDLQILLADFDGNAFHNQFQCQDDP